MNNQQDMNDNTLPDAIPYKGPITNAELESLAALIEHAKNGRLGLVRSELDGLPCAVISAINDDPNSPTVDVSPFAILVYGDLFKRMTNPEDCAD